MTHEEPAREPEPGDSGPRSGRKIWGLDRNVFLSSVLGVNKSLIGVIEGIAETTASLLKMFAGWLSDRLGRRKPLMLFGYSVSTLSRPLLALAGSWGVVLGARFVDRFGKGVRTAPRDAIVADSCEKKELGRSFGFHRAMDQFGAVVGPAVAFLVLTLRPGGYRTVFWISLIPGVLCVLVIALFIRERRLRFTDGGACEDTGAGEVRPRGPTGPVGSGPNLVYSLLPSPRAYSPTASADGGWRCWASRSLPVRMLGWRSRGRKQRFGVSLRCMEPTWPSPTETVGPFWRSSPLTSGAGRPSARIIWWSAWPLFHLAF